MIMGQYELASAIKAFREKHQLTQVDMAKKLNMSRQRYSRLENGKTDVSFALLNEISQIFNVTLTELIPKKPKRSQSLTYYYSDKDDDEQTIKNVEKIEQLIKTLFAHEKLFYDTNEGFDDDV